MINQCDGCQRKLRLNENSIHEDEFGRATIGCTKHLYEEKLSAEDILHIAVCQAVSCMSQGYNLIANSILRQSLVDYADLKADHERFIHTD